MTVSHKLNQAEINRILTSREGPVARTLLIRGLRVQTRARKNLGGGTGSGPKRVDTGLLRASIATQLRRGSAGQLIVRIGTNVFYGLYVHEGTGIYGPKRTPIRPVTKRYLRYKLKGSEKYVFAKQVKGMRPNPFLSNALPAANLKSKAAG